ncbi:hypothetical protein CEP52_007676 [Fusarium oligoseptatum]|uniref:Uncharacterized protein n=1 Tax=Fusarium oligoseptatum TaxID=2604345 RepID=A0A428TLZ4_9HYPO|nr:hypothetical protein CEP52_007676 [Fusarium oligoseptatum]
MAGKTRRSKTKAKSGDSKPPTHLPLDIIYNIGLQLSLDPSHRLETLHGPCPLPTNHNKDLRALTYSSRATKDLLEPLLYRHVVLMKPQEVCSFFITLAEAPHLRQHVRHFGCVSRLNGPQVRKDALPECRAIWRKNYGSKRGSVLEVITKVGFPNMMFAASVWERKKNRFVFNADFRHDAVLEMLFVITLFLLPNVQTFVWKDLDGRPFNVLLTYLFDAALMMGVPLMPKLKVLNTWKETLAVNERAQFFMYKTNLWENLETLYLNSVDLDNEFTDMVLKGDFKKNLPVKKLYVHCPSGAENLWHPGMYHVGQTMLSETALDSDHPDTDKGKFKAFRNLELLDIKYTWFENRALEGSRALKSLLHAVGAPERLNLIGHPLPMKALSTGVVHSRLKYLKVKELIRNAPSSVRSRDALIASLNDLWDAKDWKRLVPNLCEIDWDHYKFRRKDLEGEDKAVWTLEDEEEWEDEDDDEDDHVDIDDMFSFGYFDGFGDDPDEGDFYDHHFFDDDFHGHDDDDDDFHGHDHDHDHHHDPVAALAAFENGYGLEELVNQLALHFHPPPPGSH